MLTLTKQAQKALQEAKEAAKKLNQHYIGTEHLLVGLRREYTGVAGQVLSECGVEENAILDARNTPCSWYPQPCNPHRRRCWNEIPADSSW